MTLLVRFDIIIIPIEIQLKKHIFIFGAIKKKKKKLNELPTF